MNEIDPTAPSNELGLKEPITNIKSVIAVYVINGNWFVRIREDHRIVTITFDGNEWTSKLSPDFGFIRYQVQPEGGVMVTEKRFPPQSIEGRKCSKFLLHLQQDIVAKKVVADDDSALNLKYVLISLKQWH